MLDFTNNPLRLIHLTGNVLASGGYVGKYLYRNNFSERGQSTGFDYERSFLYALEGDRHSNYPCPGALEYHEKERLVKSP